MVIRNAFEVRPRPALDKVNSTLDRILSLGRQPMIWAHDLRLSGGEMVTKADIDVVVVEIREQLLERVRTGSRIRVVQNWP